MTKFSEDRGYLFGKACRKITVVTLKFVVISCVVHPICHISTFLSGFGKGFNQTSVSN